MSLPEHPIAVIEKFMNIWQENQLQALLSIQSEQQLFQTILSFSQELEAKQFKIAWLAQAAHLGMSQCLTPKLMPDADAKLSNRKITMLRWTADGKTSSEISSILNITERTVNFHINNAIAKLNAANKTSAAIKAAMLGLL